MANKSVSFLSFGNIRANLTSPSSSPFTTPCFCYAIGAGISESSLRGLEEEGDEAEVTATGEELRMEDEETSRTISFFSGEPSEDEDRAGSAKRDREKN